MATAEVLVLVFAWIGLADTLYLIYHFITKTDVACPFFPPEWCRIVQHAPQSRTLGIPNPILGFGMYAALLVLIYLFMPAIWAYWAVRIIITIGFLFSLYFTYVQGFVLKAFCTWCVISALNFVMLFIVSFYLTR